MKKNPVIVWLRKDLRINDNPAIMEALKANRPIIFLYIHTDTEELPWKMGAASNWWLHHSLKSLNKDLSVFGQQLIIRRGVAEQEILSLIKEISADTVYWNRRYEPQVIKRDADIKNTLKAKGIEVKSFNSALLFEPWQVQTAAKTPYKVYTPFWNACNKLQLEYEESVIKLSKAEFAVNTLSIEDLNLLPKIGWDAQFYDNWQPGEEGALKALNAFTKENVFSYQENRNLPAQKLTSRLSPHFAFGEISLLKVWKTLEKVAVDAQTAEQEKSLETYKKEIVWREFAYHLLYHFPETDLSPLRKEYENFPWEKNSPLLKKWQQGITGYPIVDAGMRELWKTGWMHNRVRMIVASFLVKDLLIPWQDGARWFWDTLVDADLASNSLGWQWTSGCGADAAPYFRIFNPISQGEKFDPEGEYVKRWCPELRALPLKFIHQPWSASLEVLKAAGVIIGENYPERIVDHAYARGRAMEAWSRIKTSR
ncbi:MAG: deoxyribodipyrimidine photo-lyase [Proteobacteria bacterium]|nr:deoxyribodipyrimidine photo-lyase [Pseudomonadota bacterium]